jgi:hypothetical protein
LSNARAAQGWFRAVYSLPHCAQDRLGATAPVVAALIGGSAFFYDPNAGGLTISAVGFGGMLCWGVGLKGGAEGYRLWHRIVAKQRRAMVGPSWTWASCGALACVVAWWSFDRWSSQNLLASAALATNIAYVGAKLRCRVFRCCEAARSGAISRLLNRCGLMLQEAELIASGVLASVTWAMWARVGTAEAIAVGFGGHGVLRAIDMYLRFPRRGVIDAGRGFGCAAFVGIAALSVLVLR